MIIRRPMQARQITGAMFGENAILIKRTESVNKYGEVSYQEARKDIRVSTNPLSPTDPRIAALQEGGIRIEDTREFFTIEDISVSPPDYIVYNSDEYIAHSAADYGSHKECVFYRREVQRES